jgi:hypothetical protein
MTGSMLLAIKTVERCSTCDKRLTCHFKIICWSSSENVNSDFGVVLGSSLIRGHQNKHISPLVEDYYAVEKANLTVRTICCDVCHKFCFVNDIHSILGKNVCISCYSDGADYDDSLY